MRCSITCYTAAHNGISHKTACTSHNAARRRAGLTTRSTHNKLPSHRYPAHEMHMRCTKGSDTGQHYAWRHIGTAPACALLFASSQAMSFLMSIATAWQAMLRSSPMLSTFSWVLA